MSNIMLVKHTGMLKDIFPKLVSVVCAVRKEFITGRLDFSRWYWLCSKHLLYCTCNYNYSNLLFTLYSHPAITLTNPLNSTGGLSTFRFSSGQKLILIEYAFQKAFLKLCFLKQMLPHTKKVFVQ